MWPNPQEAPEFGDIYRNILTGKLHFLCSEEISFRAI